MQTWGAIWETPDYIEEHYEEELTIGQLLTIAHLSRFCYQQLFYRLTRYTVSEYLRSVQLKMVTGLSRADNGKIMDIAMQCEFSSHSALTRAFRRYCGMSLAEYHVSSDIHLSHVIKSELHIQYTLVDEGVPLICGDTVLKIQRRVRKEPLWFNGYTKEGEGAKIAQPRENTLVALWDRSGQDDILQHTALDEGNDILMPSQTPGAFTCMAAVHTTKPVKEYIIFEMPVGTYAVYEYEAESFGDLVQKALCKASAYPFGVWLSRHGYTCDVFLIQRHIRPKQEDCRLQLWVKISDSLTL